VRLDDLLGGYDVAQRLGHLLGRFVEDESVRQDGVVGSLVARGNRGDQRHLEPAAVLVDGLDVEVGGPLEVGALTQHRLVRTPGIEPDVENRVVGVERVAAAGTPEPGRQQFRLASSYHASEPRSRKIAST